MKYALVTGGTKGIGYAYSQRLLKEGYYVIINYASDALAAKQAEERLNLNYAGQFVLLRQDLSKVECIGNFCNQINQVTNVLDLVIFNVGYTDRTPFPNIEQESWEKSININLTVPLFTIQHLIDNISDGGCILFTSSLMGVFPHSLSLSYGVSKSAVNALVSNLVKFLADRKIRVNSIAPGFIETEWQANKPKHIRESIESKIASGSFGSADDIADAMMFIVNNQYVNGQCLIVDGGYCYK